MTIEHRDDTDIAWLEIEVGGVKVEGLRKICNTHSEMPELVHWGRAFAM